MKSQNVCRYEDHDFIPNVGWLRKGITQFSEIEKIRLSKVYPSAPDEEKDKWLVASKSNKDRTIEQILEHEVSETNIFFSQKNITLANFDDGDKDGIMAQHIIEQGGTIVSSVTKKTDYLIINTRSKRHRSVTKLNAAFSKISNGCHIGILTGRMFEDFLNNSH